jgi:hypothetical protein
MERGATMTGSTLAKAALAPTGIVIAIHGVGVKFGMTNLDSLSVGFLVWVSYVCTLIFIFEAIETAGRQPS